MADSKTDMITAQRVDELHRRWKEAPKGSSDMKDAFMECLDLKREIRSNAVARGIEEGEKQARQIYGENLPAVTDVERHAIWWHATRATDHLDDIGGVSEEVKIRLLEMFASSLTDLPVLRKALAACNEEWKLGDDPPPDGIVGSALDEVLARLAPYRGR